MRYTGQAPFSTPTTITTGDLLKKEKQSRMDAKSKANFKKRKIKKLKKFLLSLVCCKWGVSSGKDDYPAITGNLVYHAHYDLFNCCLHYLYFIIQLSLQPVTGYQVMTMEHNSSLHIGKPVCKITLTKV